MDGKRSYLNEHYSLRVVVVDHTGHRTAYYDYSLSVMFATEFESGDVSDWSRWVN